MARCSNLLWKAWIEHTSLQLDEVQGSEPVPDGWGSYIDGDFARIEKIDFQIKKEGHLLIRKGTATKTVLTAHGGGETILGHIESKYESPFGRFELVRVTSEEQLLEELGRDKPLVTSSFRVKVPRIMYDGPFGRYPWLPDDELFRQLSEIHERDPAGYALGTSSHRVEMGSDIGLLFEKPSEAYLTTLRQRLGANWNPTIWNVFE